MTGPFNTQAVRENVMALDDDGIIFHIRIQKERAGSARVSWHHITLTGFEERDDRHVSHAPNPVGFRANSAILRWNAQKLLRFYLRISLGHTNLSPLFRALLPRSLMAPGSLFG